MLARITFQGKAQGVTEVAVVIAQEPAVIYPLVQDTQNKTVYAERLGKASLAVARGCPSEDEQPHITNLAQVNVEIRASDLQLGASPTPIGETPGDESTATPEDQTATPAPPSSACIVSELQATAPAATPTLGPGETPAPVPPETAAPTPEAPCTPAPTPVEDDIVDVQTDSDTTLIIGAIALLTAGTVATGGGLYLLRQFRGRPEEDGSSEE